MEQQGRADGHGSAKPDAQRGLLVGLLALAVAIGIAATVSRTVGGVLLVASWALLLRAIHRLGRSGPA